MHTSLILYNLEPETNTVLLNTIVDHIWPKSVSTQAIIFNIDGFGEFGEFQGGQTRWNWRTSPSFWGQIHHFYLSTSCFDLRSRSSPNLLSLFGGAQSALSSPSGSGRSQAAKRVHFVLKNASSESNFKGTFTVIIMFVFSLFASNNAASHGRHK